MLNEQKSLSQYAYGFSDMRLIFLMSILKLF